MLQVGDAERFPLALGFESLDLFLTDNKQGRCFTAIEEDGDDKRLVELAIVCEADVSLKTFFYHPSSYLHSYTCIHTYIQ